MINRFFFSVKVVVSAAAVFLCASVSAAQNAADTVSAGGLTEAASERFGDFNDRNIGVEMVFVKGGTFTMGCTAEQGNYCYSNEKPTRSVTLGDFYIGRYEITQKQWSALMGDNPSARPGDSLPVENVLWDSVKVFIEKLNAMTADDYWEYRLPTEAEWEYAARGGAMSAGYAYSGGGIGGVAWYEDDSGGKTNPVGSKAPNELGVYDMSGNVWELVGDRYGDYDAAPRTDPSGPRWGNDRVVRGGGWSSGARACRVSNRVKFSPSFSGGDVGFRLALGSKKRIPTPQPSQLALAESARSKFRRGADTAATAGDTVAAAAVPTAPIALEIRAKGRRPRGYEHKFEKGVSAGIGVFYSGEYGGGIAWANGEELAMPRDGGGAYLFVDAVYAEAFAGYSGGGGKWKSPDARSRNDLPEMSRSCFNAGVLLKYPVDVGAGASRFFPIAGFDYEASVSGKLEYANGSVYEFDQKNWLYGADALNALWLRLGCGFNVDLAASAYLRAEALYGFRTANAFERQGASLSARAETRPGRGLTCRVGVGFKQL